MAVTVKKQVHAESTDGAGAAPNTETVQIDNGQGLPIAGTPMFRAADGYWDVVATNGVVCHGFLAETIDTEKAEGAEIRIVRAQAGTRYVIRCDHDDTDKEIVQASVGNSFGVTVSAVAGSVGYTTLNLNEASTVLFSVVDIMYNKEPLKYALADAPGTAIVTLLAAALLPSG